MSYLINNDTLSRVVSSFSGAVRVATTANLNLAATLTVLDGVTLGNGDRVLVKDQTTASENGIYVWSSGTQLLTRSRDGLDLKSMVQLLVQEGTENANQSFQLATPNPITVGVTNLTFEVANNRDPIFSFSGAGTLTANARHTVDPSGGGFTLDLPATPQPGAEVKIKNVTGSSNPVTIDGNGNTIDGEVTYTLVGEYVSGTFVYTGSEWYIESGIGTTKVRERVLWEWNETDLSQFDLEVGSGVNWSIGVSTFPGTDVPAVEINNLTGVSTEAIWSINDADTSDWPDDLIFEYWSSYPTSPVGHPQGGPVLCYEDSSHWVVIRRRVADNFELQVENGASGSSTVGNLIINIADESDRGDLMQFRVWARYPNASTAPSFVAQCHTGHNEGSYKTWAFVDADADADWASISPFNNQVGFYYDGFGQITTVYHRMRILAA